MPEGSPLVAVVETAVYLRRSDGLLSEGDRRAIVDHLAANPSDGDIVPGGGGIRKVRLGIRGRGKRGGVRIIHYFADRRFPVFILDVFAKNEMSDYSAGALATIRVMAKLLTESYGRRRSP